MSWLQDPAKTAENYATEANLRARQALYEEVEGELSEWMDEELAAEVSYVDVSPGMVELARARGIAAQQGDVQELPFADASFDLVVAAWMLYHVPDLNRGLSEIARVLVPGGTLVAVTTSVGHLEELRALMHYERPVESFRRENGEELLSALFASVERHDVDARVTVRRREQLVGYQESIPVETRAIPDDVELPFITWTRVSIFVATR